MGIVKRNSITITILSYLGIVVGYVNKILLFPNFLSEEQVGLANILVSMAVMYAQFSAMGINSTIVKFFPFFRTPALRKAAVSAPPCIRRTAKALCLLRRLRPQNMRESNTTRVFYTCR